MKRISFRFALTARLATLLLGLLAAHPALASGPVVGWGDDLFGQATPPSSVDGTTGTAAAIAAGGSHSCAIQAGSGAVVCWGLDDYRYAIGAATPPPSVDGTTGTAAAIAAGGFSICGSSGCVHGGHSCAIQAETGAVVCWGDYLFGQASPPLSVDGTTGTAAAIAAGGDWFDPLAHSCAIQAGTGAVVCWGADSFGQASPPLSVDGTTGTAAAIAAGGSHSCAIQAKTGAVVCWGDDRHGQATPPLSVDGTTGTATAIAAGGYHSCAIQAKTGAVVCWGDDRHGQATPPLSLDGNTGTATAIAAGGNHTLAIRTPECSDGIDNDGDGWIDLDDPPCSDGDDDSEVGICGDGIDNDGDGFTDFVGGDSGCANPDDSSENDPTLPCDDGIDNDSDGSTDFPSDPGCSRLLDNSESPDPMHADVKLKIGLKFNKTSKDKILVKVTNWQLPAGVVPTDVTVNVGGAECTGTLDAEGKFESLDRRDSITMKRGKKTQLWNIAVKRKNNDFAADLWDEGCTDADNPKPGLPVTVPVTIEVGGVAYGQDVDLVYTSKIDAKGIAK